MTSYAPAQRRAAADALLAAGEDAPTLCEGWTARDLAAHLVARERRPDSMLGIRGGPLAGWTERVRGEYARRPFAELVELVRTGPGLLSPFALPFAEEAGNLVEYLIHTEDARRGRSGWTPRELPEGLADEIWRRLRLLARLALRSAPAPVVLARPGGGDGDAGTIRVGGDGAAVVVTGEPLELLLWVSGRRQAAQVRLDGDPEAVRQVQEAGGGM